MNQNEKIITLNISGKPKAQPRARHAFGGVASTTGKAVPWRKAVTEEARRTASAMLADAAIMQGKYDWLHAALRIDVNWFFETDKPQFWGKPYDKKPDRDNLDKLTLDAIVDGGLINNDAKVAQGIIGKWYAPKSGMVITIRPAGLVEVLYNTLET